LRDFLSRRLRRYREDLFGGLTGTIHRSRSQIDQLIVAVTEMPPNPTPTTPSVEGDARDDDRASDSMKRYWRQAWMARALLGAGGVSAAVLLHRLLLGDFGGALASLGSAATLLGLAMHPAYRCWTMRRRHADPPRIFLTHPLHWWPPDWRAVAPSERSASHEPADR
jgi:hypothetical protein